MTFWAELRQPRLGSDSVNRRTAYRQTDGRSLQSAFFQEPVKWVSICPEEPSKSLMALFLQQMGYLVSYWHMPVTWKPSTSLLALLAHRPPRCCSKRPGFSGLHTPLPAAVLTSFKISKDFPTFLLFSLSTQGIATCQNPPEWHTSCKSTLPNPS